MTNRDQCTDMMIVSGRRREAWPQAENIMSKRTRKKAKANEEIKTQQKWGFPRTSQMSTATSRNTEPRHEDKLGNRMKHDETWKNYIKLL